MTQIDTSSNTEVSREYDLIVIGGGPGGYSAAFRAADLGLRVVLIERHATLGGVCLNVGCIPSKALLHVSAVSEEAQRLAGHGIIFGKPGIDLDLLRTFKSSTVRRLTDGLERIAHLRKVQVVRGTAQFFDAHRISVTLADGGKCDIGFTKCIIAVGSFPIGLPVMPDDPRIVNSTGALALAEIPKRLLVVGGGIIGLEIGTVYSALGARVDIVEQSNRLLSGVDQDLVDVWMKQNQRRFDRVLLSTEIAEVTPKSAGLDVRFKGAELPIEPYGMILQSVGRLPNSAGLNLPAAGVVEKRGFISVDTQMRTNVDHIFAIGDVIGQPMLAHKAVHQGHIAAEVVKGMKSAFDASVIPSVAYTDPEIGWVGLTEDDALAQRVAIEVARFPWGASGRAIANGAAYGLTKLIFSKDTGRVVGGAIVGPNAGDLLGEICLAIEMGANAADIGRTIHPHPTLGETIGMAAEVAEGVCTDLPPKSKVSAKVS
jgi:dihydrolipoamide dehydrogenase